ncbi:hypothetical protein N7456_001193 [Penicillium angulare]|uniref:Major facilitator superfamily (MFS) profile domain-containing protein n=1 Tax=Penicillium angulare TaxID=116970 RepID=A0A9W9GEL0_9EURO|nr:hypothetical protein N7456_001193 [Penicillium angulare]
MDIEAEAPSPDGATTGLTNTKKDEDQPETAYMEGWALASLTVAFMAICLILALDNTILSTAIPRITSDFHSINDIGWYGSSYLIAQMALLPTCGRLYTFYNIKWMYCLSLLVFELGSVIAAIAPTSNALIIGRAVSGLGAAGLAMLSPIVLGVYNIGSAIGPLVGGSITDNPKLGWRFIFWINLPFGAVGLVLLWFSLRKPPPAVKGDLPWKQKLRQLDLMGATLLLGSTSCLCLALQWGGITYPWSDPKVFGCLIGFGMLLIAFLYLQYRGKERFGHYVPLMWFGPILLALGGGLFQLMRPNSPFGHWVVLSKPDIPTALVIIMFFQMLGGALAPSVGQNLFTDGLLRNLDKMPGVDVAAIVAAGATDFRSLVPAELMDVVVAAFNSALRDVFWFAFAAPALAWGISWLMEWRKLPDYGNKPEAESDGVHDSEAPVEGVMVL